MLASEREGLSSMHNQIIGSAGMDQDTQLVHDNTYGHENWVDMSPYQHQTTMADYGATFAYMPPISHGLPSESLNRMPPQPPPQQSLPQVSHPPLPMLMVPGQATWPSMLTHPHNYGAHSAPVVMPSTTVPLKTTKLPAIQTASAPRKTLTDDDRRRMCEYHEQHPQAKQTDIGNIFGVERSTVSKVLRNKEKYLCPEDKSSSPVKRTKGRPGADIEKTLLNYVRNAQKNGLTITSDEVRERARVFSATMGSSSDSLFKSSSSSVWLERFMQKHGIGGGKLTRRASETNIPDAMRGSPSLTSPQPSSAISPASPAGHQPSPLSANRGEEDKERIAHFVDYGAENNAQSTASLSSAYTDAGNSSFSGGSAVSPSGPFTFSPDPNMGGFQATDQSRQVPGSSSGLGPNFQRPRSQTFPTLDLEYMNQPQTSEEPITPRYHVSSTAPSSALESPENEISAPPFGMDQAIASPPHLRRTNSSSSLARSTTTPVTASSPSSPTQDDARRAADTLLSFISSAAGFVDQHEYMAVVRLTEKLRLHQTQQLAKVTQQGMGGLSRIPEGDSEMTNAPPNLKVEGTTSA